MKKHCFLIFTILFSHHCFAQEKIDPLYAKEYKLKNGLTVYLNEDHNQPGVYGMVAVRGGSKRDPKDATGMAHYLEHLLFKGTDIIGTVDYPKEKVFLDSIRIMYDELRRFSAEKQRDSIRIIINNLENKAAAYAIPNEIDRLVSGIGGTQMNAFTSDELIVYLNMFPGNQVEKWIEIYSQRFINPVFRLFQSELETVYEEKNRSMDNFGFQLFETFQKNFYKNSPYGQQPTIGLVEHLKNPSLTKMIEYFNTWYVPNNMALILCGDFNTNAVIPLIEEKFGKWQPKDLPVMPQYREDSFKGREFMEVRLTPVRIGMLGFRTVPKGHPDEPALTVCNNILFNWSETGLFNKLVLDNKLLAANVFPNNYTDMGGTIVFFVPKIVGQKMSAAENLLIGELEKIRKGTFDTALLEAVKLGLKKDNEKGMEDIQWRAYQLLDAFLENKSWEVVLAEKKSVEKISMNDVIRVANQYYGNNYLALWSKMGFPKKQKLQKPPYKPVQPENAEAKSEFAKRLELMQDKTTEPRFIEFGTGVSNADVLVQDIQNGVHFYYTPNPVNKIFTLKLKFLTGRHQNPVLEQAATFVMLAGTGTYSLQQVKSEFQKLGTTYQCYADRDYFTVELEGFDEKFTESVKLLNELLTGMVPDETKVAKLLEEARATRKVEKDEPNTLGEALKDYAVYGQKSPYLNRLSLKEIKNLSTANLINEAKNAMGYEADVHYSGTLSVETVAETLRKQFSFAQKPIAGVSPVDIPVTKAVMNTVYFIDEPKAVQSQIFFIIVGEKTDDEQRTLSEAFNEYFGAGMFSLVFQEIREFRSLAYAAYAYYRNGFHSGNNGYLSGYIGTQSDKTIEALQVFMQLVQNLPEKSGRIPILRSALVRSIDSDRGTFRELSDDVADWKKQNYTEDPRKKRVELYSKLEYKDIDAFYRKNIAGKNYVITILGDKARIDFGKLASFGKIVKVDKEDILK